MYEMNKTIIVSDDACSLELGEWSKSKVDQLLREAQRILDPNRRMKYIMFQFIETQFQFESQLEIPGENTLMVRFKTFDCITFFYYMLVLNVSVDFEQFVNNLARLRYKDPEKLGIHSDPLKGNILDFTYNVLLVNAARRGFLRNITGEISGELDIETEQLNREITKLWRKDDWGGGWVYPKYGCQSINIQYIKPENIEKAAPSIKTGDMILFVLPLHFDRPKTIFGHGAMALKGKDLPRALKIQNGISENNESLYFLHSTRSLDTDGNTIGVNIGGEKVFPDLLIYDSQKPRLLMDYCIGVGWLGVVVLRPLSVSG
jgi:hypothetical protein